MKYFYDEKLLPKKFQYPELYRKYTKIYPSIKEEIAPWYLIKEYEYPDGILFLDLDAFKKSSKFLVPFARYDDDMCDDVACFEGDDCSGDPRIFFYCWDDLSQINWEERYSIKNFSTWLELAKKGDL